MTRKQLLKLLSSKGYEVLRITNHIHMINSQNVKISIPNHNKLSIGILRQIQNITSIQLIK